MTDLRRPRIRLATLGAILLASLALPALAGEPPAAEPPAAEPYRAGGPITLDTTLLSVSGASAWAIDEYLAATTPLPPLGAVFLAAERTYGINARFLLAAAMHETAWGTSYLSRVKHNLFGYNAYDRDPLVLANAYETYAASIDDTARFMKDWYLTPGGRWWGGQPTLRCMQQRWSSTGSWGVNVSRIATAIRLDSLSGGSLTFRAPAVSGPLHGGDPVTVDLAWKGGAIPDRVAFVATWSPIALDADGTSATPDASPSQVAPPAVDASQPTGLEGAPLSRVRTRAASITLAGLAPIAPGTYMLDVEMRDSGGGPLPVAEQADTPSVEVRVWGDRAVRFDVEPSLDGTGVVITITNIGRVPIPARGYDAAPSVRLPEVEVVRSIVTVAASSADPLDRATVFLVTSPLAADLPPGASLTLDVPRIAESTGRTTDWLSASLVVLGDPAWLGIYGSTGTWFAEGRPAATAAAGSAAP